MSKSVLSGEGITTEVEAFLALAECSNEPQSRR